MGTDGSHGLGISRVVTDATVISAESVRSNSIISAELLGEIQFSFDDFLRSNVYLQSTVHSHADS